MLRNSCHFSKIQDGWIFLGGCAFIPIPDGSDGIRGCSHIMWLKNGPSQTLPPVSEHNHLANSPPPPPFRSWPHDRKMDHLRPSPHDRVWSFGLLSPPHPQPYHMICERPLIYLGSIMSVSGAWAEDTQAHKQAHRHICLLQSSLGSSLAGENVGLQSQ